ARRDDARAVRADQPGVLVILLEDVVDAQHVQDRNALGNADDDADAGGSRFKDGIGRERRRHVDHAGVGTGFLDRLGHGVEHGQAQMLGTALARRHAADQPGAVIQRLLRMERALGAGEALTDDLGVLVDQNGHGGLAPQAAAAATAFFAASLRSVAGWMARPDSASSLRPCSTLVPSRRAMTGTVQPTSLTALMMPSAMRSLRTMPPKMLTRMAFTLGLARMILKASLTRSALVPPPTSRKLAGSPPCSLMTSMVAMARPAPFTMQAMLPSMVT